MKTIVIFGECMIELVEQANGCLSKRFAGDTFNTAVYLKRCLQQVKVHYLTAIGPDKQSDALYQFMTEESLSVELVQRVAHRHLGLYMVHTDKKGERSFTYWRSESAATQTMNSLDTALPIPDLFYLSGISLAILDEAQRMKLVEQMNRLRQHGCNIAFDLNYRPALWKSNVEARKWADRMYELSDIALSGVDDHAQLYGHDTLDKIVSHLSYFPIKEKVVKNGAEGVYVQTVNEDGSVPVAPVEAVVDTTAAGDAFNAGYLAARGKNISALPAAQYGAKVAACVIGYPGAITPRDAILPSL